MEKGGLALVGFFFFLGGVGEVAFEQGTTCDPGEDVRTVNLFL